MNVKITADGWQSSLDKFFKKEDKAAVNQRTGASPGDLLLIVADKASVVNSCLGMLRLELAKRLNLLKKEDYALVWVTKFPLLEYNEEEGRLESVHHPFTIPPRRRTSLFFRTNRRKSGQEPMTLSSTEARSAAGA